MSVRVGSWTFRLQDMTVMMCDIIANSNHISRSTPTVQQLMSKQNLRHSTNERGVQTDNFIAQFVTL
jgi:hypothetical protein